MWQPGAPGLAGMTRAQMQAGLRYFDVPVSGNRERIMDATRKIQRARGISMGEWMCMTYLCQRGIPFEREWVCEIAGSRRYFDFWLPLESTIIEYHGAPHFRANYRNQGVNGLRKRRDVDVMKADYVRQRGWKMVVLDDQVVCIDAIAFHLQLGLAAGSKLYLSNPRTLRYIQTGLRLLRH